MNHTAIIIAWRLSLSFPASAGPSLDTVQCNCNIYRSVAVISCLAMHDGSLRAQQRNCFSFSSPPFESDWDEAGLFLTRGNN